VGASPVTPASRLLALTLERRALHSRAERGNDHRTFGDPRRCRYTATPRLVGASSFV